MVKQETYLGPLSKARWYNYGVAIFRAACMDIRFAYNAAVLNIHGCTRPRRCPFCAYTKRLYTPSMLYPAACRECSRQLVTRAELLAKVKRGCFVSMRRTRKPEDMRKVVAFECHGYRIGGTIMPNPRLVLKNGPRIELIEVAAARWYPIVTGASS